MRRASPGGVQKNAAGMQRARLWCGCCGSNPCGTPVAPSHPQMLTRIGRGRRSGRSKCTSSRKAPPQLVKPSRPLLLRDYHASAAHDPPYSRPAQPVARSAPRRPLAAAKKSASALSEERCVVLSALAIHTLPRRRCRHCACCFTTTARHCCSTCPGRHPSFHFIRYQTAGVEAKSIGSSSAHHGL